MGRAILGLGLGLFSIFVSFAVYAVAGPLLQSEIATLIVMAILMMAYFFICQFFASRGNPDALRKDRPVMLLLGAGAILVALITALKEKREVFLTQGLGSLLVWVVGTLAGALTASLSARRRSRQQ
jgi:O-antigen/teichoic acid export membrane protein